MNIAACAAAKVSNRSPSTTTRSGASRANASANPIAPSPTDLATPTPGIAASSDFHGLVDHKALIPDMADGVAELGRQMHPGGDKLQFQPRRSAGSPASARPAGRNRRGCRSQSRFFASHQSSRACMLALLGKLIRRRSIDSATRRSPSRAGGEHRKLVHQRPGRAGAETGGVERGQHLVAQTGMRFVEQDRVQPVVAGRSLRLARELDAGNTGKRAVDSAAASTRFFARKPSSCSSWAQPNAALRLGKR